MKRSACLAVFCLALACAPRDEPARTTRFVVAVDTIANADEGVLALPADMNVLASGQLAVLEYSPSSIVILDQASGALIRRVGSPGAGPGELQTPLGLQRIGDTLLTLNAGNQRIERFLLDGTPLPSRRAPNGIAFGRFVLSPDGGMLQPTGGADVTLVRVLDSGGELVHRIGTLRATFTRTYDRSAFRALAEQLLVPDYYANDVLAAAAPDSVFWLAFNAFPEVLALRPSGDTVASFRLPDSVSVPILHDYRERNRAEVNPNRFQQLLYFADLRVHGPFVWALLRTPPTEEARAVVLNQRGELVADITFAGAKDVWRIAPDLANGVVYLSSASASEIYRAPLPTVLRR